MNTNRTDIFIPLVQNLDDQIAGAFQMNDLEAAKGFISYAAGIVTALIDDEDELRKFYASLFDLPSLNDPLSIQGAASFVMARFWGLNN